YSSEERKQLRDKLVEDCGVFFKTSNDVEEIVKVVIKMSPYTNPPTYKNSSTLNKLNYLLKEGSEEEKEKYNEEICASLLNVAHTRLLYLIQIGVYVSKEARELLGSRKALFGSFANVTAINIFGRESTKIDTILKEVGLNKRYYECLDFL